MKRFTQLAFVALLASCAGGQNQTQSTDVAQETVAFPYTVTEATPKRQNLSVAVERAFNDYMSYRPEDNPLYTSFTYTPIEGLDYNGGDGTVSRRDPSKVIKVGDKYYMYYTKRDTKCPPIGAKNAAQCDDETPSTDWDCSEIWCATSKDGFTWSELGCSVPRANKPETGHRSVSTPDILVWKGKYYLYYQAFNEPSGLKGDYCPVSMSYADSPEGPWTHTRKQVIPAGAEGEWDQFAVHDPYPLVHNGKIYIYYKSAFNRPNKLWIASGIVTADDPAGPFTRSPKNPIMNSGHEVALFPFKTGVAAIVAQDGNERNTIQYAPNWDDFSIAATVDMTPTAAGAYVPDAFTNTTDGIGIKWGICHFTFQGAPGKGYSILDRFDCCLTQTDFEPAYKSTKRVKSRQECMKYATSPKTKKARQEEFLLK
ncbi:MAG: family 43 glycosylhydrolase [Rikenellaceae bacterium]